MLIQCARVLEAKLLEKHKTELDVSSHQTGNKGLQIKKILSTDDEDLANELSNDLTLRDQFIIVPGSVAHIDQTLNISYAEMEKVVLDHLLISYADHVIISPGRFGEFAVGRSLGGVKTVIRSRDVILKNGKFNATACLPEENFKPFINDIRWGN